MKNGYKAEVTTSKGKFFGHVTTTRKDFLSFEADSIEELTQEFHSLVEEYLELCQERGIDPNKVEA